ncbi:hypothetical protein GDO86_001462, partial [Hymenochirus boettgeri]
MWGWSGEGTEKKDESKSGSLEELMTREEKTKLYAAIGYSETVVDPTLPKTYEAVSLCVKLLSMSIHLREEKGKTEFINLAITDLSTVLKQRPGAQAIRFEAQIGTFEVTGTQQEKAIPCLLSSRNVVTENSIPLLTLMFETNPVDERADQRLHVESQPLEVIYDAKTINNLVDFFRPPQDVHLEQLASATLTKLEEFRDKTSTGLLYVIETQKVLDLKINLMASYIIVPQNGFYEHSSNLLLLDLGNLKMVSKSRTHLPQLKIGQSSIEDIMSRAYESFDVQLSSMQLLYRKANENWKEARKLKHSSQHILEPMDLKVEFSRAMVVTDARMPKIKLYGQLPLLSVQISDQKLKSVLELIDSIPKPESPPEPSASPKRISKQKSPQMNTPQLAARKVALVDLPSLMESESEEEFYDAPASPVEEMPFFEVTSGSLSRSGSLRRKKLIKQETLKNMTEFQMRFDIPEVVLQICSLTNDAEKTVLQLEVQGLGTELNVRTFDMSANAFLKEISLKCPQYTDDEKNPVSIITTLDNTTDDLLTLEYIKADINGPEFKTTYKNTEQFIKVNFSSLDVHLHTEALLSTMNFLTSLVPQSENKEQEQSVQNVEDEKTEEQRKKIIKKSKYDDVINLHVSAELSCLRVFLRGQKCRISEVSIEGLDSQVIMRKKVTEILAKLKNIAILDCDPEAYYKKAVCIKGKEVFNFKMLSYVDATEGAAYTDMNMVDSIITLTVGCIQVFFVNKFVSTILGFINNFQAAKEALAEATVHAAEKAASGVKELAQHSFRLALDINVKAPVIIVPQSCSSSQVLVADLGLITVKNQFSIVTPKSYNLPPVVDSMTVKLSELKLYRTFYENGSLSSELQLLEPVNLDIVIERNLAADWYHDIPNIKITGQLKPMNLILGQEDLTLILRTLNENLGETSEMFPSDLEKKERTSISEDKSSLQLSAGTTVVTAAVVETYTPVKIKTTLKLDFNFDSLALNLYRGSTDMNQGDNLERNSDLKLAEFKLGLISTAVKMSSDGTMNAAVKLTNCTMDDKRQNIEKATPRMLEMKTVQEKNVMVDVSYKQGREGTILDVIVRDIYLCASVEFLLTVADIFVKANEQSSAAQKSIKQTAASKEPVATQNVSKLEMNVMVKNPEIVFVADLSRADAPALVVTTQCELCIKNSPEMQNMTATVKDLHMKACPFLPEKRVGKVTTILQPCDLFFQSIQSGGGPQMIELSIKALIFKVSPVIINTVITITSALSPSKEAVSEATSPVPLDLWKKKNVKDLKMWFFEEAMEIENKSRETSQMVLTGETLKMSIESIIVTLEAGVGHRTLPMLLAKSSFSGDVKDWSTLINLHCQLELEVHCYNEVFGVWEPLLEPLEIKHSDDFRPWSLEVKMKKKPRKKLFEMDGEEEQYKIPEYITVINIFSKDHLNITLSKCGIVTLNNLAQAFSQAASQTADVFKKDQAPFVVKNCLGLTVSVCPSDSFTALNVDAGSKKINLYNGECLNMDYIQTKSQMGQFSAMTSLSSKHFYIKLTPLNHSHTDKIPLTKVGRSLFSVQHLDSGVERYMVCQVDSVEGTKCITIRSPLQIRNHFSIAFGIYEDGECLGVAASEDEFNIPLASYRSSLCFKPILNEGYEMNKGYEMSEGVSFEDIVKNDGQLLEKKCHCSRTNCSSLRVNIVPVKDILISSDNCSDNWDLPYVVHLWPTVVIRNLLPYQIKFSLEDVESESILVDEGCSSQIHNAVLDRTKLMLQLLNYIDQNWEAEYHIQSKQADIHFIIFRSVTELDKTELDIAVHVTYNIGLTVIAIHSPYWMVNKTGRMLQYKADDIHRKHVANLNKPLLFSFKPKNFFQKNKVQLMITDSELSDPFSIDTVGSHGEVKCKSKKRMYQVGVTIYASSFNLTRIVTFTPFFMVTNRSNYNLLVNEEGLDKMVTVGLKQCVPFWPENSNNKLTVNVEGCQVPSKKISFNTQDNTTLLHLGNKLGAILVDVTLRDHSTIITFSDYHAGTAPFLIINDTKAETITFYQSSVSGETDSLSPGQAALYAWEDPTSPRELTWKCGKDCGAVCQTKDWVEYLRLEDKVVYLVCFMEGLQRILLFTENDNVFHVTYDNQKAELAEKEITISLANIGISLVNNFSKQEVSYIGITSSDVVWETKKRSRWRPLSVKQTQKLEEAFKEYNQSAPNENKIVELDADCQVCLTPNLVGMKFLQPTTGPIRRSFLPALKLEYSASAHQTSIRLQVYRIQIQNQIPGAIFPIVFYPVKPPKSVTQDTEPKPLTDVSILMRTAGHSEISVIKYFKVLIQEMDLRIDLGFLYALLEIFTQSSDVPDDQEVELFKKDIESLQAELSTVSSTTSSISLYEFLHISPIKLHLSFSLSTGGDDGNKEEREKEIIPVQSLNLVLKSIGATLTDVQDVVFKLAFFELQNQFYTTQELQWEVIRHYSKQAIKQMYVLVLGLDVLGNPFGFFRDLSEGVEAFFYEPYQGAIQGPEEFVEGMALGVKALVGGAVGGLAGAASRITGAMAKGVAAITMDEEYQQKRREAMNKQPSGIKEGLTRGGKGLVSGFVSGITGIVTKPIKGAQKDGAAGFFKGVGKGLVGAVTRPTGGIIDMASSTFQGIKRATDSTDEVESLRPPRFILEDGVIRPYRMREGAGSQMLQKIENGRFAKCKYFAHAMVNSTDLLMVMKSGILFVTKGTFGQLTCEWQYSFDEFTNEPFIVSGRRLRIEAKERVKSVFHTKEFGKIINFRTPEDAK